VRRSPTRTALTRAFLASLTVALLFLWSCAGVLSVIEDRLPPPHETANGMIFSYHAPSARQVTLAGNFNNWGGTQGGGRYDPSIDPMTDVDGDGVWQIVLPLPPGRYQYKFVVDGGVRWEQDPNNPDKGTEAGIENSLIIVPPTVRYDVPERITGTVIGGGALPSVSEIAPRELQEVVFELEAEGANDVTVAGTFNDWDANAVRLTKGEDGVFRATVEIEPGTYEYKFVVDGTWVEDPANPDTVDDGYGGVNSILTVE
jgi:1,4-alpha-glucan branching enzyme